MTAAAGRAPWRARAGCSCSRSACSCRRRWPGTRRLATGSHARRREPVVHVLAAALWTGGLLALAVAARRGRRRAAVRASRGSRPWPCGASSPWRCRGIVNAGVRLGSVERAGEQPPTAASCSCKAGALLVLAAFGQRHRTRTVPGLAQRERAEGPDAPAGCPRVRLAGGRRARRDGRRRSGWPSRSGGRPRRRSRRCRRDPGSASCSASRCRRRRPPSGCCSGWTADGFALAVVVLLAAALRRRACWRCGGAATAWPVGRTVAWAAACGLRLGDGRRPRACTRTCCSAPTWAHTCWSWMLAPMLLVLGAPGHAGAAHAARPPGEGRAGPPPAAARPRCTAASPAC